MKNKLTFLLATLFLLTLAPQVEATDYCGDETTNFGGYNMYIKCYKEGSKYIMIFTTTGTDVIHSLNTNYGSLNGSGSNDYKNYGVLSADKTQVVFTFPGQPTGSSGSTCLFLMNNASGYCRAWPSDINWDATCGPVLAITSAEVASKTSSEIVLNVTSTEATKYKVVCTQFTKDDITVSSGTAADGQITLSGLSASTTYSLTVYAKDDAGNVSSSGITLSVTTDDPPAETTPPTINSLSSTLTGDGYSTANITVNATDNVGVTRVVIKNGSSILLDEGVTSTTSLSQAFAVSGLPIGATTTLTVIVYDAAGNNASKTISVTTNAPNPQMTSASLADKTENSITLNVASTGGNAYKVVYGGNTLNTTATDGKITITGLNSGTSYTFTVYAMYDTYQSSNSITVTAKTVEVGCFGTSTSCSSGGSDFVTYTIKYIGGNIIFTVNSTTSNKLSSCKLVYTKSSSDYSGTTVTMDVDANGTATYVLSGQTEGTLYFKFTYKTSAMGSEGSTASSGWTFNYPIGGCAIDDGIPYMQSATKAGATTSSITLDVSAVVNIDGVASSTAVTQYKVSIGGAAATTYTATNGQITINDLTASTSYDFEVWAVYGSNTSTNSKTITASTNKESECEGARGHFADASWAEIDYKIEYDGEAKQIKITVTCATQTLTTLQTEWTIPGVVSSAGMENFTDGVYTKAVTDEMLGNPMLIRIQYGYSGKDGLSVTADGLAENSTGIIYYVVGECSGTDAEDPVATSATAENVGNTTADIRVVASDDTGITRVVIKNGGTLVKDINIDPTRNLDQAFTVTGLTRNTTYSNFSVTVYDRENKSATASVPSFTTTDTPEPTINSASEVLVDASMAILAVTSTQANQYKVVEANGLIADQILQMTSGTVADGRITVTGLKRLTEYTFYVYAMYNNTVSSNYKVVTIETPNGSECSGTRGHYQNASFPVTNYEIYYEPSTGEITFTLTETQGRTFTYVEIQWEKDDGSALSTASTANTGNTAYLVVVSGSQATYTCAAPTDCEAVYIRFLFSVNGGEGQSLTAADISSTDPNAIYYKIGECDCIPGDTDKPTMGSAKIVSITDNSVTLEVEATDPTSKVSSYKIGDNSYYAINRKITISDLEKCTNYTWEIFAKDPSCNVSDNSVTVNVTTASQNYALGKDAEFGKNDNTGFTGAQVVDGDLTTRGGSQDKGLDDLEQALVNSTFQVDLGEICIVDQINIYWERACATDYELQVSLNEQTWSTIERYTSMPKWVNSTIAGEVPERGVDNMVYRFYPMPARYLRVVPKTLYVAAEWGMSIYEFEAYGPCDETTQDCPIVLGVRSVSTKAQSAVIQVSAIDAQNQAQTSLTYIVTAETTIPGRTTISNTYTFEPNGTNREDIGATDAEKTTANLTLDGLIPGAYYTITVQAQDQDDNLSCNENSIEIRTGKAESCLMTMESSEAIVTDEWLAFPDGMSYEITLNNETANQFEATISFKGVPTGTTINNVYLSVQKQYTQTDCYAGWVDTVMNAGSGDYTLTLHNNDTYVRLGQDGCGEVLTQEYEMPLFPEWPNLELAFLIETSKGNYHTRLFDYNAEASISGSECEELFIIYHNGSQPADDMKTQFAGGSTEHDIRYYRLFHPNIWEDLTLPFDVSSIQVYDPDDHKYYDLKATTTSSTGNFLLRTQEANVSGENFIDSWHNGSDPLPQKDQPYAIRFTGDYYKDKFVLFNGTTQDISDSFTVGTPATGDDMYNVYGNTTMMPQEIGGKAYLLPEDHSDALYRLSENAVVRPFETYVLASQNTYKIMSRIGPWQGGPNTATSLEDVEMTLTQRPEVMLYTITGQPIAVFRNTTIQEVADECYNNYPAGSYIICAEGYVMKMVK